MEKAMKVISIVGMLLIFSASVYSDYEECSCADQTSSLSQAIKGELEEVFDSENGFAAGGADFINNLPDTLPNINVVSSGDITLTEHTPTPPIEKPSLCASGNC